MGLFLTPTSLKPLNCEKSESPLQRNGWRWTKMSKGHIWENIGGSAMMPWTIVQLSPKPQMGERRSSGMITIVMMTLFSHCMSLQCNTSWHAYWAQMNLRSLSKADSCSFSPRFGWSGPPKAHVNVRRGDDGTPRGISYWSSWVWLLALSNRSSLCYPLGVWVKCGLRTVLTGKLQTGICGPVGKMRS